MTKKLLCSLLLLLLSICQSKQQYAGCSLQIIKMLTLRRIYSYTTVFNALKLYRQSQAQSHLHQYLRDEQGLKEIKKGIDYRTINKNSKGVFRIREFLFQEKVEQNYIAPLSLALLPLGKWTRQDMKTINTDTGLAKTEQINQDIINNCAPALRQIFCVYYNQMGKPRYNFILEQEIGKVGKMTPQEFTHFVSVLKTAK